MSDKDKKQPRLVLFKTKEYGEKVRVKLCFENCVTKDLTHRPMHAEKFGKKQKSVEDVLCVSAVLYRGNNIKTIVKNLKDLVEKIEALDNEA